MELQVNAQNALDDWARDEWREEILRRNKKFFGNVKKREENTVGHRGGPVEGVLEEYNSR